MNIFTQFDKIIYRKHICIFDKIKPNIKYITNIECKKGFKSDNTTSPYYKLNDKFFVQMFSFNNSNLFVLYEFNKYHKLINISKYKSFFNLSRRLKPIIPWEIYLEKIIYEYI